MKEFFKVTSLEKALEFKESFSKVSTEKVKLNNALGRILAEDIICEINIPDFARSTMDGFALSASSTFGASESSPGFLIVKGSVEMGKIPEFSVSSCEAARIPTGGMLPKGANSVVMVEHTEEIDESTIEVYKSVAPNQHVIEAGEDLKKGDCYLFQGQKLRPQEIGLLAALGIEEITVYKKPKIAIISTGDEVVAIDEIPKQGQIRDVNSYTLSNLVRQLGAIPVQMGIVKDNFNELLDVCKRAVEESDMILISGGSSVGYRDFTIEVIKSLSDSEIFFHGVSIKPGKPTILASISNKIFWGLPGHIVSAMIVFQCLVQDFIDHISGLTSNQQKLFTLPAILNRNLASVQGRVDFVRVKLLNENDQIIAEPIIGKSGLINTMVQADGLIKIGQNVEGLEKGSKVFVALSSQYY